MLANTSGFVYYVSITGITGSASANAAAVGEACLLYTSDAADERSSVDLGGRRIIKKKKSIDHTDHATINTLRQKK